MRRPLHAIIGSRDRQGGLRWCCSNPALRRNRSRTLINLLSLHTIVLMQMMQTSTETSLLSDSLSDLLKSERETAGRSEERSERCVLELWSQFYRRPAYNHREWFIIRHNFRPSELHHTNPASTAETGRSSVTHCVHDLSKIWFSLHKTYTYKLGIWIFNVTLHLTWFEIIT